MEIRKYEKRKKMETSICKLGVKRLPKFLSLCIISFSMRIAYCTVLRICFHCGRNAFESELLDVFYFIWVENFD